MDLPQLPDRVAVNDTFETIQEAKDACYRHISA